MTTSTEQRVFALLVAAAAIAAVTVALVIGFGGYAGAAEMNYCKIFANRMSAMALQRLLGMPFVDAATGKFLYRKSYTFCVNADEEPPIVLSEEQQPLITGMPSPPTRPEPVQGSVPATDPADAPVAPVAPKAKAAKAIQSAGGQPQQVCLRAKMKTTYAANGHSWRCTR